LVVERQPEIGTRARFEDYPLLSIKRRPASIFDCSYEDFEVLDDRHHAPIKAPAV